MPSSCALCLSIPPSLPPSLHPSLIRGGRLAQSADDQTTPQSPSPIRGFPHAEAVLNTRARCGKARPAAGGRRASPAPARVLCAHLETRGGHVLSAVYDLPGMGRMGRMAWSCGALVLLATVGSCGAATLGSVLWSSSNPQ